MEGREAAVPEALRVALGSGRSYQRQPRRLDVAALAEHPHQSFAGGQPLFGVQRLRTFDYHLQPRSTLWQSAQQRVACLVQLVVRLQHEDPGVCLRRTFQEARGRLHALHDRRVDHREIALERRVRQPDGPDGLLHGVPIRMPDEEDFQLIQRQHRRQSLGHGYRALGLRSVF